MNKNTWFDHPVVRRALSLLAALVIVAGLFPAVAVQAEAQYGYVNYDEVRFRRQANSTVVWAMLDTGWVVEIRDEKRSGGVDYYYVCTNIPKHTDREYYGYISQEYITLMTAEEVAQWKDKGGNGGELNTTPEENAPAVMTNYATPNNASTNYYSFDGSELKSLGLLSENTAYYVSGSSTINGEAYYIITVDGVNCYARADAMSMLTTGDGDDTPDAGEDPTPTPKPAATPKPEASSTAIGQLKIRPSGSTNIRKEAKVNTNNVLAQAEQGDILPYYATSVINGSRWYYVYYAPKDVFGYVLGTCVTLVDNDPTVPTAKPSTPTPVPGSGYVVLTAGGVNLREEASMSSEVLGRFDKGDVFPYYSTVTKGKVTWYKVSTDEGMGYFHGDFVTLSDSKGNPLNSSESEKASGYVLTTVEKLYLRKTASTSAGTYGQIKNKGTLLKIVGNKKSNNGYTWYNVEFEGEIGYVRGDCVQVLTDKEAEDYKTTGTLPTPTPSPTPVPKPTKYIITVEDNVWIRKSPSTKANTAGQVKKGSVLQFDGTTKVGSTLWYEITFDGATRYIKGSCVKVMTDVEYNDYLASLPTPTPTPSPTPAPDPATLSNIALTNIEKVIVRANGNSSSKQLALIYKEGTECKLLGDTNKSGGYTWYYLKVSGTTGWIRGDLLRILTKTEAEMYEQVGDPDAKPEASYTTLQIGSTGDAVTKLQNRLVERGYLKADQVTGVYDVNTRAAIKDFQSDEKLTVDGIAGSATQHALFGTVEEGYYNQNNGSSTTVKLYKPELIDWYKGGIQSIFYKGAVATVTDVRTGISFKVKRWSGAHHADVEPRTAADTAAMCRIYGVDDAQEISDKNMYQRRPVLVTINGHSYAASMFGMPHNYPAGDTISGNDFYGQFCIHFTNSQLHDGKGVDKPSAKNGYFSHTMAIQEAYEDAVKKLNIK